ncbi:MAG: M81 family metallopeptidase [Nitriliruptoraceae bacterium]
MATTSPRRVLVGAIRQETNSFTGGTTGLEDFRRRRLDEGPAMFDDVAGSMVEGAMRVAAARDIELVPSLIADVGATPPVEESCFRELADKILAQVSAHRDELDAVFLPLHGAMTTTERPDPEGDLITEVRDIVGDDMPIAVSLDLHTHVTDTMTTGANLIIGFRTCPHIDIVETGERAMTALADILDGGQRAFTAHRKIRLMSSAEAHDTTFGPLTSMQARARELEQEPGVLAVSIFATQPWMDVPDLGWSVTVTSVGDHDEAQRHADTLARELWDARDTYHVTKMPIPEVLQLAAEHADDPKPVVASDGSDSPTAGGHGDGNALLRHIVEHEVDTKVLMLLTDRVAVRQAADAGEGTTIEVELGGHHSQGFFTPLPVTAEVLKIADGKYRSMYPPVPVDCGITAVLKVRNTTVVVTEYKVPQLEVAPFSRLGLDIGDFDLVQVKSAGAYRAAYTPLSSAIVDLDGTGPCDSDLTRMPFQRITRPLWPFDPDLDAPW